MPCCGCCPLSFQKEFQRSRVGLHTCRPCCLYTWQFKWPAVGFLVFKSVLAIYTLIWLIINIVEAPGAETNNGQSPFVFLTTWSYILLNLYLYSSLATAVYMMYRHARDGHVTSANAVIGHVNLSAEQDRRRSDSGAEAGQMLPGEPRAEDARPREYGMTWFHGAVWVLHDMITGAAPVVTLIYFAFLYPLALSVDPAFAASALDINIHGVNTLIMLLDNFFCAIPIRVLHAVYPMTYGMIYVVFSLIYFALDPETHIPYPGILDWRKPEVTIPVVIVVVGILMPLLQLLWYLWYRLRLWTFQKVYKHPYCDPALL